MHTEWEWMILVKIVWSLNHEVGKCAAPKEIVAPGRNVK